MSDTFPFPKTGLVRLKSILGPQGPIPVSPSTWWQGVKDGRFPQPAKLGPRTTVWKAEDIRALFEQAAHVYPATKRTADCRPINSEDQLKGAKLKTLEARHD